MCLHCGLNLSEVFPSWLKDLAGTPGGLARSKETNAPDIRGFGQGLGGPRNDTILVGLLFQDGKNYGIPINSWLLCLLCFPCDGSRRFTVTPSPNSERIIRIRPSNCLLYDIAIIPYDPWILFDDVCSCFFSLHVGKVWLERFHNGQPNVSEIDWNMCSLAQALWKSLTSRARWRALKKAGDKTDWKAFPYSL